MKEPPHTRGFSLMQKFNRTRLAPTPSGYLHLGNILSFSLTAALARRTGASILLRIDDLDRERVENEFLEDIFATLDFLEIPWDEGPGNLAEYEREWSQVHRMKHYREALERLKASGKLFACDCSRSKILRESPDGAYPGTCREKNIPLDTEGCNWRIRTDASGDAGSAGGVMTDFVVRKKDGYPAYQLTSVVDDLLLDVDLVVRGEDLRASTAAQQWLADQLGYAAFGRICFFHHPLLMNSGKEKLSKSAGATSIQYFRRQGLPPAEIYQMIAGQLGLQEPVASWEALAVKSGMMDEWDRQQ